MTPREKWLKLARRAKWTIVLTIIMAAVWGPYVSKSEAASWTVPKLVKHAHGKAENCKVARRWGKKQMHCAALVVSPRYGEEAFKITGCETGGRYGDHFDGRYKGPGQFSPSTWRNQLPRWIRIHSWHSPPWVYRAMVHIRKKDGDWHQWPYCSKHAL